MDVTFIDTFTFFMAASQPDPATFIDCRVGRIVSCKNIEGSSKLYSLEVDMGNDEQKHVVSAAKKFYSIDDLKDKLVCVFANCQPGELFDEISEGILLGCAKDDNHVELLEPPMDNQPGDRIYFGSFSDPDKEVDEVDPRNKHWNKMLPELRVDRNGEATYKGENIYTDYGNITAPNLTDCPFH